MKILILISIIMLFGCSSTEIVKEVEKEVVTVEFDKPKLQAPDPLTLRKIIEPKSFEINGVTMYCVDQVSLKNQINNTQEYKRYLKEMLLYVESLEVPEQKSK